MARLLPRGAAALAPARALPVAPWAAPAARAFSGAAAQLRMRFAESAGPTVDIGFSDGTDYRFDAARLQSVAGEAGQASQAPKSTGLVAASLSEDALAVTLEWDSAADLTLQSTFDADMPRACADELAAPIVTSPLSEPFRGPAVWTGAELAESAWWGHELSRADIDDLISATASAKGSVEWRAPGVPEVVPKESFPIGRVMAEKLQSLADELEHGKGLAMIRNMPVDELTEEDFAVMYLGVSAHIGHVAMQSSSGLRSVSRGYGCRSAACRPR